MALNCASGINATTYRLLALSNLAGKTLCPVLLPASSCRLCLLWVPNLGPSSFQRLRTAGTPLPPSLCPLRPAHWRGTSETQSLGSVRPTSLDCSFFPTSLHRPGIPQPYKHPGFSHLLGEILPSLSFQTSLQVVFLFGKKAQGGQDFCSSLPRIGTST